MTGLGWKTKPRRAAAGAQGLGIDHRAEAELIRRLWAEQRAHVPLETLDSEEQGYLDAHLAMPLTMRRRLAMIDWLAQGIRPGDRVLEWGCRHGVDSCVYRRRFGPSLELYGCDYIEGETYRPFHEYSGLKYVKVNHSSRLEHPDGFFDVVTGNGVWEHVLDETNSLLELHRVLRPGGLFMIACLPNRYSYTEALQRKLGHEAHDRLYTIHSATEMLRTAGFEVLATDRRLLVPTMLNGFGPGLRDLYSRLHGVVWTLNSVLERVWPINLIASNLMFVARRPLEA